MEGKIDQIELARAWAKYALGKDTYLDELFEVAEIEDFRMLLCFLAGYFGDKKESLEWLAMKINKKV